MKRDLWLTRLSLAFFSVSMLLLVYCAFTVKVTYYGNNFLGLAEKLDIQYWLGLFLIVASTTIEVFARARKGYSSSEKLFLLKASMLAIYLLAIPAITEESVFYPDTWLHSSGSMSILGYGTYKQDFYWYANEYPGAFVLGSAVYLVTGANPVVLMKYYPLFSSVLLVLASYALLKKLLSDRMMVRLATIFLVAGIVFVFPRHFSPASVSLILYLTMLCLAFSRTTKKSIGLTMFLALVAIVSHPTTIPFLILPFLTIPAVIAALRLLFEWRNLKIGRISRSYLFPPTVVLFIASAWLAWFMFGASDLFGSLVALQESFFSNLSGFLAIGRVTARLETSSQHSIGQWLKISYTGLYFIAGVVGASVFILNIFKRKKKEDISLFVVSLGWIVACVVLGIATGFLQGGELYERSLLYGIIPVSVLAIYAARRRFGKVFLLLVIIIGAPLSIFAAYSNEYFQYAPITDSYGSIFMLNHGIRSLETVDAASPTSRVYRFYLSYWILQHGLEPKRILPENEVILVWSEASDSFNSFYLRSRTDENSVFYWLDEYPAMVTKPNFNLVYDNGAFRTGIVNATGH